MKKKKLPLVIDGEILIRSLEDQALKAKSRILGARHGHFILIEDPLYQVNERLSTPLTGPVYCQYFNEGYLYIFPSRVLKSLGDNLTLLDYPRSFEVETIRQHPRIRINIKAAIRYQGSGGSSEATLIDISEGGCQLIIPSLLTLTKNMLCELNFNLPDRQNVEGMQAKVRDIRFLRMKNSTKLGLQFIGPPEQINKISSFARFCMFFKV